MTTSKSWTEQEKAILRNTWPKGTLIAQKALPHRSIKGLQTMAKKLGFPAKTRRKSDPGQARPWVDYEIQYLYENYARLGPKLCAKQLNRSVPAVSNKAVQFGLCVLADGEETPEPETDPWAAQPPSQVVSKSWKCEISTAPRWVFDLANHL